MNPSIDPSIIAPGKWYSIHDEAYHAKTEEEKRAFVRTMKRFCEHYPCAKCRKHATEYIAKHPIEKFWNTDKGLFKWSWIFHNDVNERLNKPLISWNDALNMYSNDPLFGVCTQGCEESEKSWSFPHGSIVRRVDPASVGYRRKKY